MSENKGAGQPIRRWLIVACLFAAVFVNNGASFDTIMIFFPAIIKATGWSHAQTAFLPSAAHFTMGLSMPLMGYLLDVFDAGALIALGAALAGGAWLLASRAHGFWPLFVAFSIYGVGYTSTYALPCSFVIANWFKSRRAIALAVTLSGSALGGMVAGPFIFRIIKHSGYHHAYMILALPTLAMIIPLAIIVRSRPGSGFGTTHKPARVATAVQEVPGMQVGRALRQWAFWAVALTNFFYYFATFGSSVHMVACLTSLGLPSARTVWVVTIGFGLAAAGKLILGWIADHITSRVALAAGLLINGFSLVLLFSTSNQLLIVAFALTRFLTTAAPLVLVPTLTADVVGLRRYGTLGGIVGVFGMFGASLGPVVVGYIFDRTDSYFLGFALLALLMVSAVVTCLSAISKPSGEPALAAAASKASVAP